MSLCLSSSELEELTGYKRGADQKRWLQSHGYYVECNARGVPRITHAQVEERRRQTPSAAAIESRPKTEPNVVEFRQRLKLGT
jgi:hypothetical protein